MSPSDDLWERNKRYSPHAPTPTRMRVITIFFFTASAERYAGILVLIGGFAAGLLCVVQ